VLLALDTSTSHASIAVLRDDELGAELTWAVGRQHSQELVKRLRWLLESCGASPADLSGVAVALGPGSFNGVRVAVATARALAFARALPLYGFGTLDVIAWGHADAAGAAGTLCAVLEAGRGEVYAARYVAVAAPAPGEAGAATGVADGLWRLAEPEVVTPEALAAAVTGATLVCGEWSPATRHTLEVAFGERARFAHALGGRRASWLAALALDRWHRGEADEPATIQPRYLRRPAVTVSARHRLPGSGGEPALGDHQNAGSEEGDARALRR
jgi:tRNA threonylcarbamoyladenosine biosynthesis protein TsaB